MTVESDIKEIKDDVKKTYGAFNCLQSQMHSIFNDIQEARSLFESLLSVFNDLEKHFTEASKIELKKPDEEKS